jgi:hypothetical protein
MAYITRLMNAVVSTSVLPAVVTLALSLMSLSANAQSDWQTALTSSPYPATNSPAWYPTASGVEGELLRLPAVDDAAIGPPACFDPSVRPADFVPELDAAAAEVPADAQFYTIDELRDEMKKLVWTKGDFKIVPYGQLWGSAFYATERTAPNGYILYVNSATEQGEPAFTLDTRRTRLGIDVSGPQVYMPVLGCMDSGGKVEIDFFGNFATGENRAGVLLRHGFAQLKNDDWRLLAGQTSDLISPLVPGTIAYAVGWAGGNIGYRRMQILLERYLHCSDTCMVTVAGSINQNIITDFTDRPTIIRPETSCWPIVMGRLGVTLGERGPGCQPVSMGVSGHIGEQEFDFLTSTPNVPLARDDAGIQTWSMNADLKAPITDRMGIQGELFTGSDLGTFFGGAFQGINPNTETGIRSAGGWVDVWYDWTPRLHSHIGYGVDDPINDDVYGGGRLYNSFLFGNVTLDVTKKLVLGFEVSNWKTHYQTIPADPTASPPKPAVPLAPGEAVVFEFTGVYGF